MPRRFIKLEIYADDKYCSNDCPAMSGDAKHCYAFRFGFAPTDLVWDKTRSHNGNLRLEECKKAEIKKR